MNILHIVAGELNGGAARGAYWLHQALHSIGVDSKVLTNSKDTLSDSTVISVTQKSSQKLKHSILQRLGKLPVRLYLKRKNNIFNTGFEGINLNRFSAYRKADIIHLHWINGMVSMKSIKNINKPVVWTMRDMWPMTGGCHYSMGCTNYKTGCGQCEELNSNLKLDLSRYILHQKRKYLSKKIKMIGISEWLTTQARESYIFRDFDVRTIYNNINTNDYYPINKLKARNTLEIRTDKKIILVGSIKLNDNYKGIGKYLDALKMLDNNQYYLCFFGEVDKFIEDKLDHEYNNFGLLKDIATQRLVYSSADVFVSPSLMDAFGKTLAESMACGTPVVCFDNAGPGEIVTHLVDGYKAIPFEPQSLAEGIKWVTSSSDYESLCINARDNVVKRFDSTVIAEKYIKLYEEVLCK